MKKFSALLLFCTAAVLIPSAASAAGQQSAPAKPSSQLTIPAGATANPDNTWSYTDKQGKHWLYTKTPAGVTRMATGTTLTVPQGAVRNPNGTWSYKDKDGKNWIYTNTPFGLSRTSAQDSAAAKPAEPAAASDWKVTDKGDTVRFERRTPMGPMAWEKKKTELNDQEKREYEASKTPKQ